MALVSDPSLAGFNSYASVAEADAYHATRLHNTTWTGAVNATKESALIWATRNFEILQWKGWMTNPAQNLQWPRAGVFRNGNEVIDPSDSALYSNIIFDSAVVPTVIKEATAEAAMWLIASDTTAPPTDAGYKRLKADVLEIEIDKKDRNIWLTDPIKNMIWRYVKNANPYQAAVVRT